ncbi:MAG: hypothetical protein Q9201_007976, partial [Fulgogasparrea decipioides]
MIDRTKEILHQSNSSARSFLPPPGQAGSVPLGSSSDSIYPGYSPAEVEYGKASKEYGNYVSEVKRKGENAKPEGLEYEVGQSKGHSRMTSAQIDEPVANFNGSVPTNGTKHDQDPARDASNASGQMFFTDTKPTPINTSNASAPSLKRKLSSESIETSTAKKQKPNLSNTLILPPKRKKAPEPNGPAKTKKPKTKHAGPGPEANAAKEATEPITIEFEDISAEVDARMAAKEEKRKQRPAIHEEKKRKRESDGSAIAPADQTRSNTETAMKPKKKKAKKSSE